MTPQPDRRLCEPTSSNSSSRASARATSSKRSKAERSSSSCTTPAGGNVTSCRGAVVGPRASLTLTDTPPRTMGAVLAGGVLPARSRRRHRSGRRRGCSSTGSRCWTTHGSRWRGAANLEIQHRAKMTVAVIAPRVPTQSSRPNRRRYCGRRWARRRRAAEGPRGFVRHVWVGMGDALVALGGAFLAAGFRPAGRRVGLPTYRSSCSRNHVRAEHAGHRLVDDPHELELLAALGLIMLLFHLGLEFSVGELISGGRRLLRGGRDLPGC